MILRNGEEPVMEMDIHLHPSFVTVLNYKLIIPELLPKGLKPAFTDKYSNSERLNLIAEWLICRAIPNWRINIFDSTLSLYHMKKRKADEVAGYQHTASVLSYYASWFDRYTLSPCKTEFVCYVFEDHKFHNLYNFRPINLDLVNEMRNTPDTELDRCLKEKTDDILRFPGSFHSLSMTIRSEMPSWWESDENGVYMAQDCSEDTGRVRAFFNVCENMGSPEKREYNDGIFKTYYPVCENILWLSELLPYIKEEEQIWEQAEMLLEEDGNAKEVLSWLNGFACRMQDEGFFMDACELGIGYAGNNAFPVVIC